MSFLWNKIPCGFLQTLLDSYSSKAIWLLFLDTNTSLEQFFTDINIPFDCQFLVAQSQNDHVVVLTEVYRVSPTFPLQTYRFGNWTAGGGFTWPSQGLYTRRNNLNGYVIQGTQIKVTESHSDMWYVKFTRLIHEEEQIEGTDNADQLPKCQWGPVLHAKCVNHLWITGQ